MDKPRDRKPESLDEFLFAAVPEELIAALRDRFNRVARKCGVPASGLERAVAEVWDPSYVRNKQDGKKLQFADEARQLRKRLERLTDPILNEIAADDAGAALAVADRAAIARMVERLEKAERLPGAPMRKRENALYENLTAFWIACEMDDAKTWSEGGKSDYAIFLERAAVAVYGPVVGAAMRGLMMKAGQAQ